MPLFEYHCQSCGNDFEKLVFNRSAAVECPSCDGGDVTKKFSTFGMKSGGAFVPSTGGSGCGSCTSHSCSTCSH